MQRQRCNAVLVRSWISVREDDSVARRICACISNSRRNVVRAVDHNRHRHANRPIIQEIFSALYIWIGSMPSDKFVLCFGKRLCRLVLMHDCWPQSCRKQLAEALILLTCMALLLKHPIEDASLQPALWRRMSDQRFCARRCVPRIISGQIIIRNSPESILRLRVVYCRRKRKSQRLRVLQR